MQTVFKKSLQYPVWLKAQVTGWLEVKLLPQGSRVVEVVVPEEVDAVVVVVEVVVVVVARGGAPNNGE